MADSFLVFSALFMAWAVGALSAAIAGAWWISVKFASLENRQSAAVSQVRQNTEQQVLHLEGRIDELLARQETLTENIRQGIAEGGLVFPSAMANQITFNE